MMKLFWTLWIIILVFFVHARQVKQLVRETICDYPEQIHYGKGWYSCRKRLTKLTQQFDIYSKNS